MFSTLGINGNNLLLLVLFIWAALGQLARQENWIYNGMNKQQGNT
jgi:hypothetical protein